MKTSIQVKIFTITYIVIMLIPAIFTVVNAKKEQVNTENRTLAEFPHIMVNDKTVDIYSLPEGTEVPQVLNKEYFTQLDDWISDHIGLRNQMIKANTFINTKMLANSPEEKIILGKNGWLYYSDTVKDYIGTASLSERNIRNIAKTLSMVENYVRANGAEFTFTVAANKSSLYSENMPGYFIKTEGKNNRELLTEALALEGVNYTDIYQVFADKYQADGEVMYQHTDSHWNYKGAFLGYKTIMSGLGYEDLVFNDLTFTARDDWEADLASMLYSDGAKPDTQLYPEYEFNYQITSRDKAVDSLKITAESTVGKHNCVIYRDSFYNTLQIFFQESFASSIYSRAFPYKLDLMEENAADTVVIEIVERNIPNLAKKAPVMQAPVAEVENAGIEAGKIFLTDENGNAYIPEYTINQEQTGEYTHYYGTINEEFDSDIFFEGENCAYMAFPIYEMELLEDDELKDNGFSIYLKND